MWHTEVSRLVRSTDPILVDHHPLPDWLMRFWLGFTYPTHSPSQSMTVILDFVQNHMEFNQYSPSGQSKIKVYCGLGLLPLWLAIQATSFCKNLQYAKQCCQMNIVVNK